MAQFQFVMWLLYWYANARRFTFEWDSGNSTKSATKHGVESDEVESVFELKLGIPIGRQVTPETDEERLCLIGPSLKGRMLSIAFTIRDGRVRPISSRVANRKEKRLYEEIRKSTKGI
jgi:uncharacterized DUF497 family protein